MGCCERVDTFLDCTGNTGESSERWALYADNYGLLRARRHDLEV